MNSRYTSIYIHRKSREQSPSTQMDISLFINALQHTSAEGLKNMASEEECLSLSTIFAHTVKYCCSFNKISIHLSIRQKYVHSF